MLDLLVKPHTTHARSVAKSISWRVLGSIDTFVLSLVITGNFVWAGSIASFEVLTKMVLYYVHERAWGRIKWGIRPVMIADRSLTDPEVVKRPLGARRAAAGHRIPAA
jgi:uncharacterized membrane protein